MATINQIGSRRRAMFFKEETVSIAGLYNWSDAATPSPNEANSINFSTTDGWEAYQAVSVIASPTEFQDGTTCVEVESLVGSSDLSRLYFTVEIGSTYRLTYWAKNNVGGDGRIRQGGGWVTNPSDIIFSSTWTEYTVDVEASSTTAYFQFWATRLGALGNKVFIDNITMIKL